VQKNYMSRTQIGIYSVRDQSFRAQPLLSAPGLPFHSGEYSPAVRIMRRDPPKQEAPFSGAPISVQTAISFVLLSGILVLVDTIVLGVRTGAWKYLIAGFWYLVFAFFVIDQLIKLKRWAWWLTVVVSSLFSIRAATTVARWLILRENGAGPGLQSVVFQILCGLALGTVFGELVARGSREAFGIQVWKRRNAASPPALQLDQVAIGIADKDLSQS